MLEQHQQLIKAIIGLNPESINMYWGYKGDYILKIETTSAEDADVIDQYGSRLGLEIVTKHNMKVVGIFSVFCIAKDEDVYSLK